MIRDRKGFMGGWERVRVTGGVWRGGREEEERRKRGGGRGRGGREEEEEKEEEEEERKRKRRRKRRTRRRRRRRKRRRYHIIIYKYASIYIYHHLSPFGLNAARGFQNALVILLGLGRLGVQIAKRTLPNEFVFAVVRVTDQVVIRRLLDTSLPRNEELAGDVAVALLELLHGATAASETAPPVRDHDEAHREPITQLLYRERYGGKKERKKKRDGGDGEGVRS